MNKKKMLIMIGVIIAILLIAILVCLRKGLFDSILPQRQIIVDEQESYQYIEQVRENSIVSGRELIALVGSWEEAENIADLYGIELVEFADGIASYTTEQVLEEVMRKGKENGYPALSINYIRKY